MLDGPGGTDFTARLKLDAVPAAGSTMTLGPKPGTLHLFDSESGERLGLIEAVVTIQPSMLAPLVRITSAYHSPLSLTVRAPVA